MNISVIVPVYNESRYLDRCLQALLHQHYPAGDFEVIVVDNGSTDGSLEQLARYPSVKVLTEARPGSYAARNAGIHVASGDLLAFTDSDCASHSEWLREIDRAMQDTACLIALGRRTFRTRSGLLAAINAYENVKDAYTLNGDNPRKYYGYTNNMAVRRSVFDRFGPFVERQRGSDTILVRTVVDQLSCDAVRYVPDMVVEHLEINGFSTYLHKMFIYGRSRQRYSHLKATEPLGVADRVHLAREVMRRPDFSLSTRFLLLGAMACTMAAWQCGSWMGSTAPRTARAASTGP